MQTRIFHLFRSRNVPNAGVATLFFHTKRASRSRPQHFFGPDEVPEFEGDEAWFEAERRDGRWGIVRRVDALGAPWPAGGAGPARHGDV